MDARHGWTSPCDGEFGASCSFAGIGGVAATRRSGSGASDFAVARWLVEPGPGRRLRGDGGIGPALAQLVHDWRGRGSAGGDLAWSVAGEGPKGFGDCHDDPIRAGGEPAQLDDPATARRDRTARRTGHLAVKTEHSAQGKRGFSFRRPRHCLKGRQDADAIDHAGLRLKLFKQQARAGDITLLFADESEALTHPYLARAWAPRGTDLRIAAPGQAKKVALMGAQDATTRELLVHTSPTKKSTDFVALLDIIDRRYGPRPSSQTKPAVLVLDNGKVHTSKLTTAALAARPWLTVEWLPRYAPELNDIERAWRDLKLHHLAHMTFSDIDHLDQTIHSAVAEMNRERMPAPACDNLRIAA
jgi:hypothetical protein